MNILICTIMRNNAKRMNTYISQIDNFINELSGKHSFSISIYENDSIDITPQMLNEMDLSKFKDASIVSDKLGLPSFGSVVLEERVKNLAIARNKALVAKNMFTHSDYILFIDSDVQYDKDFIPTLLDFDSQGINPDVYSGICVIPKAMTEHTPIERYIPFKHNGLPQKSGVYRVYDTWATRRTSNEEWGTWFSNAANVPMAQMWTTYNSVCLYKAKPFQEGIRFDHINERLNKFDLEVAVVCEKFRNAGYNDIWVNQNLFCYHS